MKSIITYHVYPDGLRVWVDGELVVIIPRTKFLYLIKQLVNAL